MKRIGHLIALASLCLSAVTVTGAESAVVGGENVIVRAQPTRFSEVLTRLQPGAPVTVLERVTIEKTKPDDESEWSRISLPDGLSAWVHGGYVQDGKVNANRLNVRAGPGENYSVLGQIENGTAVESVSTQGDWVEIAAPEEAYAYIATRLLEFTGETNATVAGTDAEARTTEAAEPDTTTLTETEATTPEPIPEIEPVETAVEPDEEPAVEVVQTGTEDEATAEPPFTMPARAPIEEPPPKRIVMREGIVKGTVSIQAPTHYELVSPFTGRAINYLYTTSTNLDLGRYRGLRIIVTGEEGMDKRWTNTPVITIQRIQVVEE